MEIGELVHLGQQLVRAGRLALHESRPGLQAAEAQVVGELLQRRFSTITELAARTGYAQSRISRAVAELREQGLVTTRVDPDDRRRSVVYLVDSAADRVADGRLGVDELLGDLIPDVPADERAELVRALETLARHLRDRGTATARSSDRLLRQWSEQVGTTPEQLERMSPRELAALLAGAGTALADTATGPTEPAQPTDPAEPADATEPAPRAARRGSSPRRAAAGRTR